MTERLGGAVAGVFFGGPVEDVGEAVERRGKLAVFGESAGGAVEIISKVDAVEADGGDVLDPLVQKGLVFGLAQSQVKSGAGREKEIVDDAAFVVAEVEAGGGGLRRMIIREQVWVGAHVDLVKQDVVVARADDGGEKVVRGTFGFVNIGGDVETEGGELRFYIMLL